MVSRAAKVAIVTCILFICVGFYGWHQARPIQESGTVEVPDEIKIGTMFDLKVKGPSEVFWSPDPGAQTKRCGNDLIILLTENRDHRFVISWINDGKIDGKDIILTPTGPKPDPVRPVPEPGTLKLIVSSKAPNDPQTKAKLVEAYAGTAALIKEGKFKSVTELVTYQTIQNRSIVKDTDAWMPVFTAISQELTKRKIPTLPDHYQVWLELSDAFKG